jgi:hypothetical protein
VILFFSSRTILVRIGFSSRPQLLAAISAIFVLIGAGRIVLSYSHTGQALDEPCHVAAGMEFLDKGTYILDAVHATLARIAIALPLYLAGERYPALPVEDPASGNYNVVGNHVLYDSGHLLRNLILARLGVLPFFLLGGFVEYLWTRDLGSDLAAMIAVFLYATTPSILAFSASHIPTSSRLQRSLPPYLFSGGGWLQRPDIRHTMILGFALGLAFLAKLTKVLFVPAATLAIAVVWFASERKKPSRAKFATVRLLGAVALAAVVIWAGNRFSPRPLQEATGIHPTSRRHSHKGFLGIAGETILGLPYAVALLSKLTGLPEETSILAVCAASSLMTLVFAHRLWGGWIAVFISILNVYWVQLSFLGSSEPFLWRCCWVRCS